MMLDVLELEINFQVIWKKKNLKQFNKEFSFNIMNRMFYISMRLN
jgi:hypothetical protein